MWNAVEKIEKAKNAQLPREIESALPVELTREQNISLAREYVSRHFVAAGMCADICIHDKQDGNPHAHIMLTMRPFEEDKTWGAKQKKEYILDPQGNKIYDPKKRSYKCKSIPATDWNEQTKAEEWRAAWADTVNRFLEQNNHAERKRLNQEYVSLKDEVKEVEKIRKNVYDIMREETRTALRIRAQDMEL